MAQIHNTKKRQPIILSEDAERVWLEGSDIKYIEEVGREVQLQAHKIDRSFRTFGNSSEVIRAA